jgi:hypothetical protein
MFFFMFLCPHVYYMPHPSYPFSLPNKFMNIGPIIWVGHRVTVICNPFPRIRLLIWPLLLFAEQFSVPFGIQNKR